MVQTYGCLQNSRLCDSPDFKLLSLVEDQNEPQVNSDEIGRVQGGMAID